MTEDEASRFHRVGMGPCIMDEVLGHQDVGGGCAHAWELSRVLNNSLAKRLDYATLQIAFSSTKPAAAPTEALGADVSVVTVAG